MRLSHLFLAMVAASVLFSGISLADAPEQVDNPAYEMWMKSNVGSSVTMSGQFGEQGGPQMTMESTRKLTEKADDHVTLEISSKVTMMGQQHEMPAHQFQLKSKMDKVDVKQIGTEDVQAAGKTFHCKTYEVNMDSVGASGPQGPGQAQQQGDRKAKIWVSDDVPGGMVKMEFATKRGTMSMVITSFTKT